jgi:Ser/Thr protein kinase RdoA (MazF antagonist)
LESFEGSTSLPPPSRVLQWIEPVTSASHWIGLRGHGGYSGAQFWRKIEGGKAWCLRCWPLEHPEPQRLSTIHRWLELCRDLVYIPTPWVSGQGTSWLETAEGRWELTPWLPGRADFQSHPSHTRLRAAAQGLAEVHQKLSQETQAVSQRPYPAVRQRLQRFQDLSRGEREQLQRCIFDGTNGGFSGLARRCLEQLDRHAVWLQTELQQVSELDLPLQPCLKDIWHDHLLFEGDSLTGIVDFGAMKVDVVATDLGRMLGSLVADRNDLWEIAQEAYHETNNLPRLQWRLARLLDRSGCLLGAINWLRWIAIDRRQFEDMSRVEQRLTQLVGRMEAWSPPQSLTI